MLSRLHVRELYERSKDGNKLELLEKILNGLAAAFRTELRRETARLYVVVLVNISDLGVGNRAAVTLQRIRKSAVRVFDRDPQGREKWRRNRWRLL